MVLTATQARRPRLSARAQKKNIRERKTAYGDGGAHNPVAKHAEYMRIYPLAFWRGKEEKVKGKERKPQSGR